jgi:hypothetical protein
MNKPTNTDIETIVQMVVDRLRERSSVAVAAQTPLAAPASVGIQVPLPGTLCLSSRIVSMDDIQSRLEGTHTLQIQKKTLLTPAVRDELRSRNIKLVRADLDLSASTVAGQSCSVDFLIVADKKKFSVAAAVASKLSPRFVDAEFEPREVVKHLLKVRSTADHNRMIWCASQPYAAQAACAEYATQLRAVALLQAADLRQAVHEVSPALLILDDQRWSGFQVAQLILAWSQLKQATVGAAR